MADISYRKAIDADWQAITDILNSHIDLGDCTLWQGPRSVDEMRAMYDGIGCREGVYVLSKDDEVIGYGVIVKYHPKEGYRYACETSVFLKPSEVGKGYGSKFKTFILAECKRLQYRHVVAKIFASNNRSIAYNKKLGYEIVGTQKGIGFSREKFIDIVIMQYLFET